MSLLFYTSSTCTCNNKTLAHVNEFCMCNYQGPKTTEPKKKKENGLSSHRSSM